MRKRKRGSCAPKGKKVMQQLLKSMKVEQREIHFHLELHFTSVGFGKWFSVKDSQQDMARKLHEMASLIEMDLQSRAAQLPRADGTSVADNSTSNKDENDRPKPLSYKWHCSCGEWHTQDQWQCPHKKGASS
jgi:hypothetical protein